MLRYCGYVYDAASELYYCSSRYYDPASGQWTSRDPAAADGAESAYQYVSGSPALASDPDGRRPIIGDGFIAKYNPKTKGWDAEPFGRKEPWKPNPVWQRYEDAGRPPSWTQAARVVDPVRVRAFGSGLGGAFGAVKRFAESRAMAAVGNAMGDGLSFGVSDTALLAYLHYQAIDPWAERNPGKYTLAMGAYAFLPGPGGKLKLTRGAAKSGLAGRLAARFGDATGLYFVKTGEKTGYVGQSSQIAGRLGRHIGRGKFGEGQAMGAQLRSMPGSTKLQRETCEQLWKDELEGLGYTLSNQRDPIGWARIHLMPFGYKRLR